MSTSAYYNYRFTVKSSKKFLVKRKTFGRIYNNNLVVASNIKSKEIIFFDTTKELKSLNHGRDLKNILPEEVFQDIKDILSTSRAGRVIYHAGLFFVCLKTPVIKKCYTNLVKRTLTTVKEYAKKKGFKKLVYASTGQAYLNIMQYKEQFAKADGIKISEMVSSYPCVELSIQTTKKKVLRGHVAAKTTRYEKLTDLYPKTSPKIVQDIDTMVHSRFEIAKKKYHSQLLDQPNKRRRVQVSSSSSSGNDSDATDFEAPKDTESDICTVSSHRLNVDPPERGFENTNLTSRGAERSAAEKEHDSFRDLFDKMTTEQKQNVIKNMISKKTKFPDYVEEYLSAPRPAFNENPEVSVEMQKLLPDDDRPSSPVLTPIKMSHLRSQIPDKPATPQTMSSQECLLQSEVSPLDLTPIVSQNELLSPTDDIFERTTIPATEQLAERLQELDEDHGPELPAAPSVPAAPSEPVRRNLFSKEQLHRMGIHTGETPTAVSTRAYCARMETAADSYATDGSFVLTPRTRTEIMSTVRRVPLSEAPETPTNRGEQILFEVSDAAKELMKRRVPD